MRGHFVIIIFLLISFFALSIFGLVFTSSITKSINEQEILSRTTLETIIKVYDKKNRASSIYLDAVSYIPNLSTYTISAFSNYLDRAYLLEANETLIEKPLTFQELQYVQARIGESINYFSNRARNYPALRTNEDYINAVSIIKPIIKTENDAIKLYNEYVLEYNKITTQIPSKIVSGFMGKFPFLYFETGTNITDKVSHIFD